LTVRPKRNWLKGWRQQVERLLQVWRRNRALSLRRKVLAKSEAERLDRIREPWKYRGK
jgi:hypothetical protein